MDSELHKSILNEDIAAIKTLIANGTSVNKLYGMKGTPLCAAIANGKLGVVKILLGFDGCDINGADYDGEPPLCLAISKGFNDIAKELIHTTRCNLNVVDPVNFQTPLCTAVCEGNIEVIDCLIKAGCDVNKATDRGNTALHYAITDSRADIVMLLLSSGASLSKYNMNGHNPLHHSIYREEVCCTTLLTEHIHKRDNDLLHTVDALTQIQSDSCLHLAVEVRSLPLLNLLLKHQSDLDISNTAGHSPLYSAVKKNAEDLVTRLLAAGANPNVACVDTVHRHYQVEQRTSSMLHAAVTTGNVALVKVLLSNGASVNSVDFRGNSPLMVALTQNKPAIAHHLLDHSAVDVLARNDKRESCLFAAMSCSNPAWFVHELVRRGCSVNQRNDDGQNPLHVAVDFECTEVIEVLLDNGCDVNARGGLLDAFSMLHVSAMNGCTDTTRMLLFYGANMNAENEDGQTPLAGALEMENYEIARMLLECGADAGALIRTHGGGVVEACVARQVPDEEWRDCFTRLMALNFPVQALSEICRKTIRQHFIASKISLKSLAELPIPDRLIRYLSFRLIV